jgi:hypothetical protein
MSCDGMVGATDFLALAGEVKLKKLVRHSSTASFFAIFDSVVTTFFDVLGLFVCVAFAI